MIGGDVRYSHLSPTGSIGSPINFVLEFDSQVAEATRNASEKAEEKAEAGSKEDSKELKDKHKSDSAQTADKKAFLVTEKFLVDVLGVRWIFPNKEGGFLENFIVKFILSDAILLLVF